MKIGIVTWHKGNIGGTLQAYALSETLKKLGHETELLNLEDKWFGSFERQVRNVLFHLMFLKSGLTRDNTYRFIKENEIESNYLKYTELETYAKQFDAVICGSDQIWSCVYGVNPYYFLQFVPSQKRVSYAPSIGLNDIDIKYQKDFCKYVSSIPHLSVREEKGAEIIKRITGLNPTVVLDPTLLFDSNDWYSVSNKGKIEKFKLKKEQYILCYYLGDHKKYERYTSDLSKVTGKKIVYVSFKRKNFGKNQIICSIEEFLALIKDSFCILTDSFHGTVLPLNMGKKAAVFERFDENDMMNQNSRIYNILKKVGAENWIVNPNDDVKAFLERQDNMEAIQKKLSYERQQSLNYLIVSLEKVQNGI